MYGRLSLLSFTRFELAWACFVKVNRFLKNSQAFSICLTKLLQKPESDNFPDLQKNHLIQVNNNTAQHVNIWNLTY